MAHFEMSTFVDTEELADDIAGMQYKDIIDFVMDVDMAVGAWDFTVALHERLSAYLVENKDELEEYFERKQSNG